MRPPSGIGRAGFHQHASARAGEESAELACEAVGRKAQELLASSSEDQRETALEALSPEQRRSLQRDSREANPLYSRWGCAYCGMVATEKGGAALRGKTRRSVWRGP